MDEDLTIEELVRWLNLVRGNKKRTSQWTPENISRLNHTLQGLLPDPVDCMVTDWSAWGSCSKTCGGGTTSRRREIARRPKHDGKACPVLEEERACSTELCEGKIFGGLVKI